MSFFCNFALKMLVINDNMMKRKPTVISCAIKNFLLAMMLSMLVGQLNITIDSAIVSNFISTDAMAAVNLCMPVNLIVSALTTLLGIGATIIGAQAIGRRDTDAVSAHFSIALQSIAVVGVIVGICSYFYVDDVVRIVCDDPGLSVYVRDYLIVYLTFSVFVILNMTVDEMVCVDGRPKKAAQAVMLSAAVNLVMDVVLIKFVGLGMAGAAGATILSTIVATLYLSSHLWYKGCSFQLKLFHSHYLRYLWQNVSNGIPMMLMNLLFSALLTLLNTLVLRYLGVSGAYSMSVCMMILVVVIMVMGSLASTLLSVGGVLKGQRDFHGMVILAKRCFAIVAVGTLLATVLIEAIPEAVCQLFGARDAHQISETSEALRIVVLMFLPFGFIVMLCHFFQLLGKLVLPPVIMSLLPVALFAGIHFFANYIAPAALWWAFPVASLAVFVISGVLFFVMRGSIPRSERIIDFSVTNGKEERGKTVADVMGLLDSGENGRFAEMLKQLLELIADDKVVDILVDKEKETPEICVKWDGAEIGALPFENAEKTYMYNQNIVYLK